MKLYPDHYYCFGCAEHGSVIDLTAKLFNLSPIEAAQKLARDFNISAVTLKKPKIKDKLNYYADVQEENRVFRLLNRYCEYLENCRKEYRPQTACENLHPLFVKSITELDKFRYFRDVFIEGSKDERVKIIRDLSEVLSGIEKESRGSVKIINAMADRW